MAFFHFGVIKSPLQNRFILQRATGFLSSRLRDVPPLSDVSGQGWTVFLRCNCWNCLNYLHKGNGALGQAGSGPRHGSPPEPASAVSERRPKPVMASSTAPSAPPSWVLMVHSSSPSTSERIRSHTGLLAAPARSPGRRRGGPPDPPCPAPPGCASGRRN